MFGDCNFFDEMVVWVVLFVLVIDIDLLCNIEVNVVLVYFWIWWGFLILFIIKDCELVLLDWFVYV